MKNLYNFNLVRKVCISVVFMLSILHIGVQPLMSQCPTGTISGNVFLDANADGQNQELVGMQGVRVQAFDADGVLHSTVLTDGNGDYTITELTDGDKYKIVFDADAIYVPGAVGTDNGSSVQFAEAPDCTVGYALAEPAPECDLSSHMVLTCFVQGDITENAGMPTIVGADYGFNSGSTKRMYASHGETGSIWGVGWKNSTRDLFSAAFVKQHSGLKNGPYSIFKTKIKETNETSLYLDLAEYNTDLAGLENEDVRDCTYGNQVGRVGLGGMDISDDQRFLYVSILDNNQIAKIPTDGNLDGNITFYDVPAPQDLPAGEEFRVFAVKVVGSQVYVGATITAAVSQREEVSRAVVYTFDTHEKTFEEIYSTNYLKGFWQDAMPNSRRVSQWLTDIDFTDDGHMILGISDRIGHRYCTATNSRLDQQEPDILMVGYDAETGTWALENNGQVGDLIGSGVGNGEGPGGGEFFGEDNFPQDPLYHNNVALGSVTVLPGTNSVVAAVFDPLYNTYSGGIHRYSTEDGKRLAAKELYTDNFEESFGKASGFGDLIVLCGDEFVELGNYAWIDENGNGLQDAGESVLTDAEVNAYNSACELIESTTTDENGQYLLHNLLSNHDYYITIGENLATANEGWYAGGGFSNLQPTEGDISADQGSQEKVSSACGDNGFWVNTPANNHTFDIGFKPVNSFDLALTKKLVGSPFLKMGEPVTFEITIYNQGSVTAQNIQVTDYLPDGLLFSESENPGWQLDGTQARYTVTETLEPGSSTTININLAVAKNRYADFVNVAEILYAEDTEGNRREDIDSEADDVMNNDAGGEVFTATDDVINNEDDEDDHDPATGKIFDLALKIELNEDRIYYAGEDVLFKVTVSNQGEVDAAAYDIVAYLPTGVFPAESGNPDWTSSIGKMSLQEETILSAGETKTFDLKVHVGKFFRGDFLDTYAEISRSIPVGGEESIDFDSTPDDVADNDAGGEPLTTTDNQMMADPAVDEDDHDPVRIRTQHFDLALIKTIENKNVKPGGDIAFNIVVYNQGTAAVDEVTLVDYIPEHLTLKSPEWTLLQEDMAVQTLDLASPLSPGQELNIPVTFTLDESTPRGAMLVNYAEISGFGYAGKSYSELEVDSKPDNNKNNDVGGDLSSDTDNTVQSDPLVDEDDHDPAAFAVLDFQVEELCLANATTASDGQFEDSFTIQGISGVAWTVDEVVNYYDISSPAPPGAPVDVTLGTLMMETPIGASGLSDYTFSARRVENTPARIVFRSEADDLFVYETPGSRYRTLNIEGNQAVCDGGIEDYTISNASATETYTWSLPSGTELNGTTVSIDWDVEEAGEIMITGDGCSEPLVFTVSDTPLTEGLMCHDHKYISLDENCEAVITPEMLYVGTADPGVLVIMLIDENGEVIPNATLTSAYVGRTVEAKVMDGCGLNSCWGYITVEDKVAPVIECRDYDLECNKLDEFEGPFATDNCDGIVMEIISESQIETFNCDPNYAGRLTRRYVAEDAYGNRSEACEVTINLNRIDFELITVPEDYTMVSDNGPLTCESYLTDDNGNPALAVTGSPMYYDAPLFPEFENNLCNIMTWYTDQVDTIDGTIKITRTFNVWEMHCEVEEPVQYIQRIDIVDNEAPIITCPEDMEVQATGIDCEATFTLPLATATDVCSPGIRYTISNDYVGFIDSGDSRLVSVPYRTEPYEFVYRAIDDSGNISLPCTLYVTVIDEQAPTVICDSHIAIGIGNNGEGKLFATAVDDGTFDNCGLDFIRISHMDPNLDGDPDNPLWNDFVIFDCEDVGAENMVVLGAWDLEGNYNQCMVNVDVQDKSSPEVTAPADVEIECTDEIYPLSQFGDPEIFEICEAILSVDSIVNIDPLCKTGTITRIFTVTDGTNTSTDTQTITVVNSDPFDISNVNFPPDYETEDVCDINLLQPDDLPAPYDWPTWSDAACASIAISYTDEVFDYIPGVTNNCFKIIRTWRVIDWCQYDEESYEPISYQQTIKVTNAVAPEITADDLEFINSTDCLSFDVNLSATGTDDCTPDEGLTWELHIDLDNDATTLEDYDDVITGMGADINIIYNFPIGNHKVMYVFNDACGNTVSQEDEFEVRVFLECNTNDIDIYLDEDGQVSISVEDVYNNNLTNCDLNISLSDDEFGCEALGINIITVTLQLDDLMTSCTAQVTVIDSIPPIFSNCVDEQIIIDEVDDGNEDCLYAPGTELDIEAEDNCENNVVITHDYDLAPSDSTLDGTEFAPGTYVITWTALDNYGNSSSCTATYVIEDNTAPECVDQGPIEVVLGDDGMIIIDETYLETLPNDNCGTITYDFTNNVYDCTDLGNTVTVDYTLTDDAGNTTMCSTQFIITEEINLECTTADVTVFLDENGTVSIMAEEVYTITPTACGLEPTVTLSEDTFTCADIGENVITVTVTLLDETIDCPVTVTVEDNLPPIIDCPTEAITVSDSDDGEIDCQYTAGDGFDVTAADNCTDGLTFTHDYADAPDNTTLAGATFSLGTHTVTWTVTDGVGNVATCVVTIVVEDNTAPECVDQGPIEVFLEDDGTVVIDETYLDVLPVDICGTVTFEFMDNVFDCSDIGNTVTVTYTITDESGNSSICSTDFIILEDVTLECAAIDITVALDENGTVIITPEDVYDNMITACGQEPIVMIDQEQFDCEDLGDNTVDITVTLNTQVINCTSIVTVIDTLAPVLTCPDEDIIVNDSDDGTVDCQYTAGTEFDFPYTDNCGDTDVEATHDYDGAPSDTTLDGAVFSLGEHVITWTVVDASGNVDACTVTIIVVDDTAPECVDQGPIEVFLGNDGMIVIDETHLDILPTDECGTITYEFVDNVYTCEDLDETVTVTYTITDEAGNSTTCMTDFIISEITTLECTTTDITVFLDENGMVTITSDQVYTYFGSNCSGEPTVTLSDDTFACNDQGDNTITVTVELEDQLIDCPVIVTVVDTIGPIVECEEIEDLTCEEFNDLYNGDADLFMDENPFIYDVFGCPEMPDNPFIRDTIIIVGLNDCGYGTITRTITITNPINGLSDQCTQVINIINEDPLTQDFVDNLDVPTTVILECGEDPAPSPEVGLITVDSFALFDCADISVSFADSGPADICGDPFTRVWTIVDACQEDLQTGSGTFTFTQTIIVEEDGPPVITLSTDTVFVTDIDFCNMPIDLSGIVTVTDCNQFTITNNGTGMTEGPDATGIYPFGITEIVYTAIDECNNISMDTLILDFDPGTDNISCVKLTYSMPFNGTLDVLAEEHVMFTNEDCIDSEGYLISYSFNDVTDTIRNYTCEDEGGFYEYNVYYWLNGEVVGQCDTHVAINDDDNYCPDGYTQITGTVTTENGREVQGMETHLEGSEYGIMHTDVLGSFAYPEVVMHHHYELFAKSDEDYRNGVSTLDLVKIQRHILGLEPLTSPYQMIAADVTHDDHITSMDLLDLRKLILHIDDEFPSNSSWRGIPTDVDFTGLDNPWITPFKDEVKIYNLSEEQTVNFVGVKIGDVDNTALETIEPRTSRALAYENTILQSGESTSVAFATGTELTTYGMQIGLYIEDVRILDIESPYFTDDQIGFNQVSDNHFIISLSSPQPVIVDGDIFTIELKAESNGLLSDALTLSERYISAELYTGLDGFESITLKTGDLDISDAFIVEQNKPNPWIDETTIHVEIPHEGTVSWRINDLSGKKIFSGSKFIKAGKNTLTIDDHQVPLSGVYFVEIMYENQVKRIKMVKLQ